MQKFLRLFYAKLYQTENIIMLKVIITCQRYYVYVMFAYKL